MLSTFIKAADVLCPKHTFHITKYRPVDLTDEIIEQIKEQNIVMRLAKKHHDDEYWHRGQSLSKSVITLVKESKKQFVLD